MTTTTPTKITAFGDDSLLFPLIIKAISENMGKGTEYNNNLIDDPGATLTKIVTRTRLSYPHIKHYLQLLADQGLVTVSVYQKRRARKKGKEIKRPTVMTVKITDKGYKYLQEEEHEQSQQQHRRQQDRSCP
jgi:predicted transcriptional regulator